MILIEQLKKSKNPEITLAIKDAAQKTYQALNLLGKAKAELDFVSQQKMARLNNSFRGVNKATDVLSFPMLQSIMPFTSQNYPLDTDEDGLICLGSIAICPDVAKRNAQKYGHSPQREIVYLFVHGLLHLLGYDHQDDKQKAQMRELEEQIMTKIGLER